MTTSKIDKETSTVHLDNEERSLKINHALLKSREPKYNQTWHLNFVATKVKPK